MKNNSEILKLIKDECIDCNIREKYTNNVRCDDCNFTLNNHNSLLGIKFKKYNLHGIKLTDSMVKSFLAKGETKVKGMTSPKGKGKFDCTLKLKENGKYWGYEMVFK